MNHIKNFLLLLLVPGALCLSAQENPTGKGAVPGVPLSDLVPGFTTNWSKAATKGSTILIEPLSDSKTFGAARFQATFPASGNNFMYATLDLGASRDLSTYRGVRVTFSDTSTLPKGLVFKFQAKEAAGPTWYDARGLPGVEGKKDYVFLFEKFIPAPWDAKDENGKFDLNAVSLFRFGFNVPDAVEVRYQIEKIELLRN